MEKIKKFSMLFIVLALSVVLLAGCGDDEDTGKKSKKKDDEESSNKTSTSVLAKESALKNVEKESLGFTERGEFVLKLKNNNDKAVFIQNVTVNFFDADGNFAAKETANDTYFVIPAQKEMVTYVYAYSSTDYTKYPKAEIELTTGTPYYTYHTSDVEISDNNTGSQIALTLTNNTKYDIDMARANVVFKRDGQIVGIAYGMTTYGSRISKEGGKDYMNITYPYNKEYKKVTFDSYDVYLVSAYTDPDK